MATFSVPDHRKVARGTLRSLIRAIGMSVEKFGSLCEAVIGGNPAYTGFHPDVWWGRHLACPG
jgi:hypothetical protein